MLTGAKIGDIIGRPPRRSSSGLSTDGCGSFVTAIAPTPSPS